MAFLQNIVKAGTAASAGFDSSSIELGDNLSINNMSMHVIGTGLNTADSTVKLQSSNNNTDWVDVVDGSLTLTSSTSFYLIAGNVAMKYYRVVFANGTNSAGTIQVLLNFN
jgi:hypothetical protein